MARPTVILDDIGYLQQTVTRGGGVVYLFSQWDRIFKDPMVTVAAIDRLVHHASILELTGPSYRTDKAKEKVNEAKPTLTEINFCK
jgi:IstB-like ATP binding protein